MDRFSKNIIQALKRELKIENLELEIPPDPNMGDYAFPCFSLAKKLKKSPQQIAEDLRSKLKISDIKIETKGPYLNFFVDKKEFAKQAVTQIIKEKDDYGSQKKKKTIIVEYASPNTNKPLHLGHVRNILLGKSVSLLFSFLGNKVIQANLNNDRGIHICKSMLAYKKFGKNKQPDIKTDHFVGKYYVIFNEELKKDPDLEKQAQEMLQRWESGDKETVALWKKMNKWAADGFEETYKKLEIKFDTYYYESDIYTLGKDIILDGLKKGVFKKDEEGAVYADLEKEGLGKKVLLRPDGTSIYITQDIYLAKKKYDDFKPETSIYVVGSEQNYHFRVLFSLLKMLGYKWADKCYHLSYGMVFLPEGKMKSREGTVVDADDLIENMKELAKVEIRKRHNDLPKKEIENRSRIIGLGALRFFILKMDPAKDMHFDPKESISFEGETGPYVQYAHARICSILERYGKEIKKSADFSLLKDDKEHNMIKLLASFPQIVEEAALHHKPSIMTRYLLDLSQSFNEFYHSNQILKEKDDLRDARLLLIDSIRQVLKNGLALLDIESPEKM